MLVTKAKKVSGDAQQKGAKDVGGADTPTVVKEPLAAETEIEHDGEALEEKAHDERDDESRNDEKNGRHEGSRTQGNV